MNRRKFYLFFITEYPMNSIQTFNLVLLHANKISQPLISLIYLFSIKAAKIVLVKHQN